MSYRSRINNLMFKGLALFLVSFFGSSCDELSIFNVVVTNSSSFEGINSVRVNEDGFFEVSWKHSSDDPRERNYRIFVSTSNFPPDSFYDSSDLNLSDFEFSKSFKMPYADSVANSNQPFALVKGKDSYVYDRAIDHDLFYWFQVTNLKYPSKKSTSVVRVARGKLSNVQGAHISKLKDSTRIKWASTPGATSYEICADLACSSVIGTTDSNDFEYSDNLGGPSVWIRARRGFLVSKEGLKVGIDSVGKEPIPPESINFDVANSGEVSFSFAKNSDGHVYYTAKVCKSSSCVKDCSSEQENYDSQFVFRPLVDGAYFACVKSTINVDDIFLSSQWVSSVVPFLLDSIQPQVVSIESAVPDGFYKEGDQIILRIRTSKPVFIADGDTVSFTMETGFLDQDAVYQSGSGTDNLLFLYSVVAGDLSSRLALHPSYQLFVSPSGAIYDTSRNKLVTALPISGSPASAIDFSHIVIDTTPPSVPSSVGFASPYSTSPQVEMSFHSSSDLNLLRHDVRLCENVDCQTNCVAESQVQSSPIVLTGVNGKTYRGCVRGVDRAGNHSNWGASLGSVTLDNSPPVVLSVLSAPLVGSHRAGSQIFIDVNFSEKVFVTASSDLSFLLETGNIDRPISYYSGHGSAVLTFSYIVQNGDEADDLGYVNTSSLSLGANGAITDASGNSANLTLPLPGQPYSLSGSSSIVIDTVPPAAPAVNSPTPTSSKRPTWQWVNGVGGGSGFRYRLDVDDFSSSYLSSAGLSYSPASDLPDGQHRLFVQESDLAGNWSNSGSATIIIDSTRPSVTLSSNNSDPTNLSPISIKADFSEFVSGLTTGDFAVTGGSASSLSGSGNAYVLNIIPTGDGLVTVELPENAVSDSVGNLSFSGDPFSLMYSASAVNAPIITGPASSNNSRPTWSWTSGGGGNGNYRYLLDNPDLTNASLTTGINSFTPSTGLTAGTHTLFVQEQNAGGVWSATGSFPVLIDMTSPIVSLQSTTGSPTNLGPLEFSVVFSEIISGFDQSDLSVSGGVVSNFHDSMGVYSFSVSPLGEGIVSVTVPAAAVVDAAGNASLVSGTISIVYDVTPPPAPAVSGLTPTGNPQPTWTWSSGGGTGAYRIKLDSSDFTSGTISTASMSYTPATALSSGAHTLYVEEKDSAGNWSAQSYSVITVDLARPNVSVSSTASAITSLNPLSVTVEFTEVVTGFSSSDISISNGTIANFTGGGTSYSFEIIPTAQGAVSILIPADIAVDAAGNGNSVSNSLVRTFDSIPPAVPIVNGPSSSNLLKPTWSWTTGGGGSGDFRIKLDDSDFTSGTFLTSGTTHTSPINLSNGSHILYVQEKDSAGNWSAMGSHSILVDSVSPGIVLSSSSSNVTNVSPLLIAVDFDETVTGFTAGDLIIGNATLVSGSFTGVGANYSLQLQPTGQGVISLDIAAGAALDSAGNSSLAAASLVRTYDSVPPNSPLLSAATPISSLQPTWTWTSGGGGGSSEYRFKLDDTDFSSGAVVTSSSSFQPSSALAQGFHTLYIQERDPAGNWSSYGSKVVLIDVTAPIGASALRTSNVDFGPDVRFSNATSVFFNWTPGSDAQSGVSSQTLIYFVDAACTTGSTEVAGLGVAIGSYAITASSGSIRSYRVTTYNDAGDSTISSCSDSITVDTTLPSAASSLVTADSLGGVNKTVTGSSSIFLSWSAASDAQSGIRDYRVSLYSLSSCAGSATQISALNSPGYSFAGVTGTTYSYKVTSFNHAALSIDSVCSGDISLIAIPGVPASVAASAGDASSSVSWSSVSGATSYKIYYKTSTGVTNADSFFSSSGSPSSQGSLTNGQVYYYRVSAVNAGGESSLSSEVTAQPIAVPSSPSINSFTSVTDVGLSVNWNDVLTETGYKVERALKTSGSCGTFSEVGTTSADGVSFADSSLAALTSYCYRVRARNSSGDGPYSAVSEVTTAAPPDNTSPNDPVVTSSTPTNSLTPTWSWVSGGGGGSGDFRYRLDNSNLSSGATLTAGTIFVPGASLGSGSHTLYVQERDSAGNWSTSGSFTVLIDTSSPSSATFLNTSLSAGGADTRYSPSTSIFFTWTTGIDSDTGIASQTLTYFDNASCAASGTDVAGLSGNLTSYAFAGNLGSSYSYKITATNAAGGSTISPCSGAILVDTTAPVAATGLITTDSVGGANKSSTASTSLFLAWTNGSDVQSGIRDYTVHRYSQSSCAGSAIQTSGVTGNSHTFSGVGGNTYSFKINAYNRAGSSTMSGCSGNISVTGGLPGPTGLGAVAGDSHNTLNWTAVAGASSYNVYYQTTSGVSTAAVKLPNATAPFTHYSLTNGQAYYYVVTAIVSGVESSISNEVSSSPLASVFTPSITGFTATTSSGLIRPVWTNVAGETGYKIEKALLTNGNCGTFTQNTTAAVDATTKTLTGNTAATAYCIRIRAYDGSGDGPYSNIGIYTTAPAVVSVLQAFSGENSILLRFQAPAGADEVKIFYGTSTGITETSSVILNVPFSSSGVSEYRHTGLVSGTTYYYAAVALAGGSSATISSETSASAVTSHCEPPLFSVTAGTYATTQSVSLSSSTPGVSIRYTTDGSAPTTTSILYSTSVSVSTSQTLRAIAIKTGSETSRTSQASYTIGSQSAVDFIEPGSDATASTAMYSPTLTRSTQDAVIDSSMDVKFTGQRSIKASSGTLNGEAYVGKSLTPTSIRRISFRFNYSDPPSAGGRGLGILQLRAAGSTRLSGIHLALDPDEKLVLRRGGPSEYTVLGISTKTLTAGSWHRLSLVYDVSSVSTNAIKVFLDDGGVATQEISVSNVELSDSFWSEVYFGITKGSEFGASKNIWLDDLFIDQKPGLLDPGNVHVTHKSPSGTSGTTNAFDTLISSLSNRWEYVNQRPLTESYGLQDATSSTPGALETFNVESASNGAVDISSATIVGRGAWVWAKAGAGTTSTNAKLVLNSSEYPITLTTVSSFFGSYESGSAYPGNNACGLRAVDGTADTFLFGTGLVFAYTP